MPLRHQRAQKGSNEDKGRKEEEEQMVVYMKNDPLALPKGLEKLACRILYLRTETYIGQHVHACMSFMLML